MNSKMKGCGGLRESLFQKPSSLASTWSACLWSQWCLFSVPPRASTALLTPPSHTSSHSCLLFLADLHRSCVTLPITKFTEMLLLYLQITHRKQMLKHKTHWVCQLVSDNPLWLINVTLAISQQGARLTGRIIMSSKLVSHKDLVLKILRHETFAKQPCKKKKY